MCGIYIRHRVAVVRDFSFSAAARAEKNTNRVREREKRSFFYICLLLMSAAARPFKMELRRAPINIDAEVGEVLIRTPVFFILL